eukprot:SAG31_NODE_40984_length_278_cov_0.653631_1_plen_42_part_10
MDPARVSAIELNLDLIYTGFRLAIATRSHADPCVDLPEIDAI